MFPAAAMRFCTLVVVMFLVLVGTATSLYAEDSAYDAQTKPQRATVRILALSTEVHGSLTSQDVYLADVLTPRHGHELARLVDAYPGYDKPLRRSLLRDRRSFRMMLVREPEDDLVYQKLFLPEDEAMHFSLIDSSLIEALDHGILASFTIIHNKTRLEPERRRGSTR